MEELYGRDYNASIYTDPSLTTRATRRKSTNLSTIKILRDMKCPHGSTAVAYTDDLSILAAGQENGSIILFEGDTDNRTLMDYELTLVDEPCTDIKIKSSPKGGYHNTILAGYFSGHIKLWDVKIGKVLYTLKENRHLYALRYHPRMDKFASVGSDFKVNLYDEETRVTERVLASSGIIGSKTGHTDGVCSAVFHPKNPFELMSAGVDDTLQFWDIRAPFAVRRIEGINMYGDALDITEDGKVVLCGLSGTYDCSLQVYDYDSGKLLNIYSKTGSHVYCCKYITPVFVGIGGFHQNTFRLINLKTAQVYAYLSGLPGCVMSFTVSRKVPRHKTVLDKIPVVALCTADKVIELEIASPEKFYISTDFHYK